MKQIEYAPKYRVTKTGCVYGQRKELRPRSVGYQANGSSYQQVALYHDGVRFNKYVHVLVAEAFMEDYDPDLQINHIDGNKENNHLKNLEQVTYQANMQHAAGEGLLGGKLIGKNRPDPQYKKRMTQRQLERATTIP